MAIQRQTGKRQADDLALAGALHGRGGGRDDAGRTAGREDALDRPGDGQGGRGQPSQRAADLGGAWPEAAPGVRTFKLSNDPKFAAKVQDVVGLYVDPPEHAIVLSVDEKSQIQALDRTEPGLPMNRGRCGTMTHDYKRHGTTTLFAALDVRAGLRICESGWMRKGIEVRLGPGDRERLEAVIGSGNSPQKHVWRARIVLLSADGMGTMAIQRQTGKGKPTLTAAAIERVIEMTLADPPGERTHWTGRAMAKAAGVSHRSVQRIWAAHGLKPHRVRTFKLSNDPKFAAKVQDVVGLYVDPPEHALVLSVDEKSQIQALDRTQPGLPMKKGRCGTMTHDYKRHGTTTLFAALDVLDGTVIGQCMARHRHQEFLKFLARLDREFVKDLELHVILNNYGTHTNPKIKAWLAKHSRFQLHFIPTGSSWLNLIERWFAE